MASPVLYVHDELVHNKQAARIVLPRVFSVKQPASVLDIGCGLGTWLSVCEELGVKDYCGIDGDYTDRNKLAIPLSNFRSQDLRAPIDLGRKFDLILCLEVGEHLPEAHADLLVDGISRHGNTILFSAAVPGQGGQHHLNEQWPAYWQEKFERHGLFFHDPVRPQIWNDENVQWWYRQNIFLITKEKPADAIFPPNAVHPELFELSLKNNRDLLMSLRRGRQGMKIAIEIFVNSLLYKFRRLFRA